MNIVRNSLWNLFGYLIPTIVALFSLSYLSKRLGSDLFGIYTILIALINYIGIFDIGVTRAIIREIAIYREDFLERRKIISTATSIILTLGSMASLLFFHFSASIFHFLNVSIEYYFDVINSLKLLAISIPLTLLNQLWISILEGNGKFNLVNIQNLLTSSFITGIPSLFVIFHPSLLIAMIGFFCSRCIAFLIAFILVKNEVTYSGIKLDRVSTKRLISFGSWITISNIISPVMVYFDRLIISNMLGARNVIYYSVPAEIISKLNIFPTALGRAFFPKFSILKNKYEWKKNIIIAWILMLTISISIMSLGTIFSEEILAFFFHETDNMQLKKILLILLIGFFFNALAQIPFTIIQSLEFAKITALLHCIEVVPYLFILYFLVQRLGLEGAAYAWSIRTTIDFFILNIISNILLRQKNLC